MPSDPTSRGALASRRLWVGAGGALIVLALAFVAGLVVGRRPVGGLTERVEQSEARSADAEATAARLEGRLDAYRGLALVHRAILDLDARNFGTANQRLDEAAATLAGVDGERLDPGVARELQAVREELAALDLRVAEDLAGQRATLAGLAERLAGALGG